MSTIVIKVMQPRAVMLPSASSTVEGEREGARLIPGPNTLSADYWDGVKQNPAVKLWLEAGILQYEGAGSAKPLTESLDSQTVTEAIKTVSKITDVETLLQLKAGTTKKGIVTALDARIAELQQTPEA